jgi:D-aspartate ligase
MRRDPDSATAVSLNLPPVFAMNPYYSGLGIARSLHGRGIRVYALSSERDAPGARSRYFHGVYEVPNGRDEPERLRDRLLELRAGHAQPPVLFPTRDFDVLFLERYRDTLAEVYALPQPENSPILRMMDKFELAAVAKARGIPTPMTAVCSTPQELELQISKLRFPVVMKPRFAYQWRRKGLWEKVGAAKAILVASPDELRARYRRLSDAVPEILLQEYVAGHDRDIVVCCCYVGRGGELLGHFTARKLKQNPPLVGTGSVVQAADLSRVVTLSVELFRAFGYSGLAEVEFKYDKALDTFFLIEINPRHWDQHELGTLLGVNLSWIAYRDIVGMAVTPCQPLYRPGRTCKWVAERELIHGVAQNLVEELAALRGSNTRLRRSLAALGRVFGELAGLLKGKKIFGMVRLYDPLPSALMCFRLLGEAFRFLVIAQVRPVTARHNRREAGEDNGRL